MNKKPVVNVGLIGCGTVGQGVVKIFQKNIGLLEEKVGAQLRLAWVCDRVQRPLAPGVHKPRWTDRWQDVIGDPSVDVVIELIGGYEPARTIVLAAIQARKQLATANKALLSKHWGEVFSAARAAHVLVYFEAAVGGGIPVIQGLYEGLAGNHIERVYGILNGTTNYILSRMTAEGLDFGAALAEAQKAGFAEADPAFVIEGVDAAHKIAILASLASGTWVRLEDVTREGISSLDVWDVRFAQKRMGLVTKLLGIAALTKGRFSVRVHPALIPATHPFANVSQEYNAIFVHGDAVGDVMFYGKGAGQMAAASAVVSDVVYLARHVANGTAGELPYVSYDGRQSLKPVPFRDIKCRHYLRFTTVDKPGVLSKIAGVLGRNDVSIASVHQEPGEFVRKGKSQPKGVPIVIVTHQAAEGAVQSALKVCNQLPITRRKAVHLRIEDL
ncbi:MAG: homoserine dehydrogenase [Elusimicrobia bacterium]|nr:homoserine dehydrogenase [Elusimicrobiota bacterium]